MSKDCAFCTLPEERIIQLPLTSVFALRDGYPVSKGHTLIIPTRHIATWFEATPAERMELWTAIDLVCEDLRSEYSPDGFNFGINSGETAGQTVPHLHLHVIPRYKGDMDDPRGGVRHVIPRMGNYKLPDFGEPGRVEDSGIPEYKTADTKTQSLFVNSNTTQLLQALKRDISKAAKLDIAVAFVFRSGLSGIKHYLQELIEKPENRFRLVTGDYLNATDPDALQDLLDLQTHYPDNCELYVYKCGSRSFHPKSYLMFGSEGEHVAYVGSSNLSRTALVEGVEWNYRINANTDAAGWQQVNSEFEALLQDKNVQPLTVQWLEQYRKRRKVPESLKHKPTENVPEPEPPLELATPNKIQSEALQALAQTRADGNRAGLVVMATGIGKTWLAAFDVATDRQAYKKVLFVAHREEILQQSQKTFRRINSEASMGLYTGKEKSTNANILFASIQTLGKQNHLNNFAPDEFDYIVVDEFHHAAAKTYRRLIDYFKPVFLLGLTATPERSDGGDLLALCEQNLVYRCDVPRGINEGLLCPYHYYGVPDDVDYKNIPWRSSKFDEQALTQAVETIDRAENIFDQWQQRGKDRTMAFCVSKTHANFMRDWFQNKGVACAAVHSGERSDPRSLSLEQLEQGDLKIVFAVDMFNEGVDIPSLDTVMMLRPTESAIIWLQQFGRGLRQQEGKVLTVIDYIGNHRSFLLKVKALFNLQQSSDSAIAKTLHGLQDGLIEIPEGCEVTYDLEAIDILQALLRKNTRVQNALEQYYKDFREQYGHRPTATETYQDGYLPGTAKSTYGSWLDMVKTMGDLNDPEQQVLIDHGDFLRGLEVTSMTKSYKMVLMRAMLNLDAIPGAGATLDDLARQVQFITGRSQRIASDFGDALNSEGKLKSSLTSNPIKAWTGTKALSGRALFDFEGQTFRYNQVVHAEQREAFQLLCREVIEWRLAAYLDKVVQFASNSGFDMKVSHSNSKPILRFEREGESEVPADWQQVIVNNNRQLYFKFAKIAVNVAAEAPEGTNILATLLREWFGPDAGLPGTNFQVHCEYDNGEWHVTPRLREEDKQLTVHKRYSREQIPKFFDEEFNPGKWNSGHITAPTKDPKHIILLVTLEKGDMQGEHQYADKFLSETEFQWQSQNATAQSSKKAQQLMNHSSLGMAVHLFVRETKKIGGMAAPFTYLGEVEFLSWEGERPITVRWRLQASVPGSLLAGVGG